MAVPLIGSLPQFVPQSHNNKSCEKQLLIIRAKKRNGRAMIPNKNNRKNNNAAAVDLAEDAAYVWMDICACRRLHVFVSSFICKAVENLLLSFQDLIDGSSRRFEKGASFLSKICVNNSIGLRVSTGDEDNQ